MNNIGKIAYKIGQHVYMFLFDKRDIVLENRSSQIIRVKFFSFFFSF